MGLPQRPAGLQLYVDCAGLGKWSAGFNDIDQVGTFQILHGVVKRAVGCKTVILNPDGIGMRQAAGQANFSLKT